MICALISSSESRSAPRTTGAIRPSSVSTATATLISSSSSIASSVTRALRPGCSRSAAATTFTTIAVTPTRGAAPPSFSRVRSSTSGVTSSSSTEVSWAAVCRLETMRLAIVPRRPRSGIVRATVSAPPAAGGAAVSRPAAQVVTSRSRMRPPGPEPAISRASSSVRPSFPSRARARGETRAAPLGAGLAAGAGRGGAGTTAPATLATRRSPTLVDVAEERMPTVSLLRVGHTACRKGVVLGTCLRDQRDRRADGDRLPGRDEAMNPAGGLGLDLCVRLVGLELEDDAAELDLLALVDEPLREQDVLGVRAELGHDHRDRGHGLRSAARVGRVTGRGRA